MSSAFLWLLSLNVIMSSAFLWLLSLNVIKSSAFLWLLSLNVIMSSAFLWLLSLNVIMSSAFLWLLITRLISSYLSCNSVLILIYWVHLWTAMVNNSTNINKRAITWTQNRQTTTYAIVNCSPGLRQEHKCGGDKRLMEPQLSLLENLISNVNVIGSDTFFLVDFALQRQYIYKQTIKKPGQIHFLSKRTDTITILNDNINMDSIMYICKFSITLGA